MNTTRFNWRILLLISFAAVALSASATVFTTNTDIGPLNTTYDGQDIVISNCTVTVDGPHMFASLAVATNGILTHSFSTNGQLSVVVNDTNELFAVGLDLTVTGAVLVANGGEIDAAGIGYGAGLGPGTGASSTSEFFDGSGGGDGGSGGMSSSNAVGGVCYDSLYQPGLPGSGGGASYAGSGGDGGGLVQIIAGGNVEIDGIITANGQGATNSRAGGGSGGGIWISAPSVSGAGSLTANGGPGAPGYGGGGGGGRIAIVCGGTNNFAGTITAYGGGGANNGGAGTVFTESSELPGLLTLNNGGNMGANSMVMLSKLADLTVSNGAEVTASSPFLPRNITIGTNGVLTELAQTVLQFSVSNMTVEMGGALSVNSLGSGTYNGGEGSSYSSGSIIYGGGGGYGGEGGAGAVSGAVGGSSYGNQNNPNLQSNLGSPGGGQNGSIGGAGGGAMIINVLGVLQNFGSISADGTIGSGVAGGGGSGGSVSLTTGTLSGTGSITANGGAGANSFGGGGGGGRILIITQTNSFSGRINSYGGGGANYGGAGTVYLEASGTVSQLILDNGGNVGQSTPLQSASGASLFVQNDAIGMLPNANASIFANLSVSSNAWLMAPSNFFPSLVSLTVLTNTTIQAGGALVLDSDGGTIYSSSGLGSSGNSQYFGDVGGGGGNGGMGGAAIENLAAGGQAGFNSISAPQSPGGAGGGYNSGPIGGNGGGALQLTVGGVLQVGGTLSANGGNGSSVGGGGGAGGSLDVSAATISGSGSITVNGGNGADGLGGGGGGGCMAIVFNTNVFVGTISAFGGSGANNGGAGTIYFKTNSSSGAQVILDNGGQNGGFSVISSLPYDSDLTLRNNSLLYFSSSTSSSSTSLSFFGNLMISNASIVVTNNSTLNLAANNITIEKGGAIIADSGGYTGNTGYDAASHYGSLPYQGGGGGNVGCGGMAISNSAAGSGGGNVDPFFNPMPEPGSGGGGSSPSSIGGNGGGVIKVSALTLTVNGTISANGGNGSGAGGGGGAGGSVFLDPDLISGSGVISANGGSGANDIGGGGGGGAVIVNFGVDTMNESNLFTGTLSAYGGLGATNGGAGYVYINGQNSVRPILILDNDGNTGTNTLIKNSNSSCGLVVRNGTKAAISGQFSNLFISSNAWVVGSQTYLSFAGNVTIQSGGGIILDSSGNPQNAGLGSGKNSSLGPFYSCSGGGDVGYGALGLTNGAPGGTAYGSLPTLNSAGTGSGGGGYSTFSIGGAGGGGLSLSLGGILQLDGIISANGGNGSGIGGGGGSGGSIYISASSIFGAGSIMANGGNGANGGGGGGGGGISTVCTGSPQTNVFAGTISAYGGAGANYGGAGLIYYQTNSQTVPLLLLDNDNNVGTNTSLFVNITPTVNVTVQRGAIGQLPTGALHPGNVLILSNSAITERFGGQSVLSAQNVTVALGGALSVDGRGDGAQLGAGAGSASGNASGGGGHGGYGGGNITGGGAAYDSIQSPTAIGSGGANSSSGSGGTAGGSLTVEVVSNLVVNGRLSANGLSGGFNAGGGAGGSIYLVNIPNLSGSGIISANGGAASGSGGGGGGGRIALICQTNNFAGHISASGGASSYPGGAGTIYTKVGGAQMLLVNGGGLFGTNTPLSSAFSLPTSPFELDISGGASVVPLTPLSLLSNLNVLTESTLTMPVSQSGLSVGILGNANIAGDMDVDYLGYPQTNGPGAGVAVDSEGSGAGYGGVGGASDSGAAGGVTYGSATTPTAFGSGGGNGADTTSGGSSGGGALRLSVLGTLNVSGNISANGDSGLQDDSGGGSGGSVWITTGTLSGAGTISAAGGDGVLYGGGGGGGGRIAIYAPTNQFTGTTNVTGGTGSVPGQPGTISLSSALNGLQILSQSPYGLVSNTVSSVTLTFSDMLNPASISSGDFTLYTPTSGTLVPGPTFTVVNPFTVQLNFPTQNIEGPYTVQVQGPISDMAGNSLTQSYTGVFIISIPTISGTITGTNGAGVAGVSIQASGGLIPATTDSNGNYSLGVPPGWTGTVTPSFGSYVFVPPLMSYTNISGSLTNQNYSMVQTISPTLATGLGANNYSLNWNGISGVTYQILWSTNLVTWQPLGSSLAGTNGPMQVVLPSGSNSAEFFQIQAGD